MPYNHHLADRVREALSVLPDVEERIMFSGVCFMVNGKMCVCVSGENLLCRIGVDAIQANPDRNGCSQAVMKDRVMKDYVYVSPEGFTTAADFKYWIDLSLEFNPNATASKKKLKVDK
jgi:TfoX/Sxy family transcriptional regulator of competence genes